MKDKEYFEGFATTDEDAAADAASVRERQMEQRKLRYDNEDRRENSIVRELCGAWGGASKSGPGLGPGPPRIVTTPWIYTHNAVNGAWPGWCASMSRRELDAVRAGV